MDDEFREAIEKVRVSGKLVIVEGVKDKRALQQFGITNVLMLSKKPLYAVAEEAANKSKDVIILTDLDSEGKKVYAKLNTNLQHLGVRIDDEFRAFLFSTKIRQIEGLKRYAE